RNPRSDDHHPTVHQVIVISGPHRERMRERHPSPAMRFAGHGFHRSWASPIPTEIPKCEESFSCSSSRIPDDSQLDQQNKIGAELSSSALRQNPKASTTSMQQ